jgi:molybdate transport system regulatory protein
VDFRLEMQAGLTGFQNPQVRRWKMTNLKLRSRHWIVNEKGDIIIGEGRCEILENIEKTGSLNQTAKIMKMSNKGVWSKVKVTEQYLKVRLVATDKKRGSRLTEEGKELLEKYHMLKEKCLQADDKLFRSIFKTV